ncbi:DUF6144 family protein [Desulfoluna butyratoxydans]|uniref:Metanogen output domain-containing protein n=1 Tax=Desulfoluna butyratoxydans TaxID=231438 RepID=A0A4U8YR49_9BACT|nr:DUF6144 family protein [Desulfoluna butyratoxydans]VFQ46815.1 hypothetical protein MSL71_44910 [Desulfoluna butyratoxydans]
MESNDPSAWINTILSELSTSKSPDAAAAVENCGRACLKSSEGFEAIRNLRESVAHKDDMDLLFATYKAKLYDNRPSLYKKEETIYLEYTECACGMVTSGKVSHPFLCNCTVGYTRQIFETLFNRPVKVTLQKSILNGDTICLQEITVV